MLSSWIRTFGLRQINHLVAKNQYQFSGYRAAGEQDSDYSSSRQRKDYFNNNSRKLFKLQNPNKRNDRTPRAKNENDTNVEEYVKTINEINREFLGIKLNTDYFKVHNEKSFEEICKADKSQHYKVNDLPFAVKSKNQPSHNDQSTQTKTPTQLPNNSAVKMLKSMISQQKLTQELERLAQTYFSDLLSKERKSRMEVNFEAEARKVIETLKASRWSFKLSNADSTPKVTLKNVTLLKGVQVNRNDNYTVDSYKTNFDEVDEGITVYTLWKKQREQYPEAEWFSQKFIVARIQAEVTNCPIVQVSQQNSMQNSTKGLTHTFVFEADLTVPPSLSLLSLTPEEHLKSYRLKPENIYITNADNKNIWFNMAYKEEEKKFKLINKIV